VEEFSLILNHIAPHIKFNEAEKELFLSVLKTNKVKRKQFIEQPGFISKYRTFVVKGAMRAFFIGLDGQEHTISLAIDGAMIGDPGSFLYQEPATLFVEAIEDSTLIQWSYESEQQLLKQIPQFAFTMMQRAQQIAVSIQRRVISQLSLSAEERYEEFVKNSPEFVQRIPLYIIASYLGMTREFLPKIRNQKVAAKKSSGRM
jgi:CRP-like cAMP-binding protein